MMYWYFSQDYNAWWLVTNHGASVERCYGPFSVEEAQLAASIHGVPFSGVT